MSTITDEFMRDMLEAARRYTVVLLRMGPNYAMRDRDPIVWEHGRRNFELRAAGTMVLLGPLDRGVDPVGIQVFATGRDAAAALMDEDPAIKAGIFTYSIHTWTSFPGDALP